MTDAIGRSWQMGTIQLDYQMPMRFGLTYMGADNQEHHPVVIHRALLGSLERFIGILIEHYAGAFPVWLAPVQVRIIPVGEDHRAAAGDLAGKLEGFRVEVDDRDETVGKRIRDAEVEKIPYVIVYGDRESGGRAGGTRTRGRPVDEEPRRIDAGIGCYSTPASRGATVPHLPGLAPQGVQASRGHLLSRCLQRFCRFSRRTRRAW